MEASAPRRILALTLACMGLLAHGGDPGFDAGLRFRAVSRLREGLRADEFWPAMHAAEGLTRAGFGDAVIHALRPRLETETDDQHRCGLAREQIRAGHDAPVSVMAAILTNPASNGRIHACESLFKVNRLGDAEAVRKAMDEGDPILELMAGAALARRGDPEALRRIRALLGHAELRTRRTAAWVLGQVGDEADWGPIRALAEAETDPLAMSFFWNALAKLGASGARDRVVGHLEHADDAVRTYSAQTLGVCGDASHLAPLTGLLDDPNADTGYRAAEAIVRITGRMLRRDSDGDSIPDCVEVELGTVPDNAEKLQLVAEPPPPPPAGADPEGLANAVRDIAAAHVGADRFLLRVRFRRPISELHTAFHIATHLDGNPDTGRQTDGPLRGVDVMYSFVDGRSDPRVVTDELRLDPRLPIRGVAAGDTIWVCDDVRPPVADGKATFTIHTLTERHPYSRCPRKQERPTGPHRIVLPLAPERKVPAVESPQARAFQNLPPSWAPCRRLPGAPDRARVAGTGAVAGPSSHHRGQACPDRVSTPLS